MKQLDEFNKLRKASGYGTRKFVELIDDRLRGDRPRLGRAERSAFRLAELYGWDAVLDTARKI